MMGILLGYLFVWSQSIWLSVFAHFINNAMSIVFTFYFNKKVLGDEIETIGNKGNEWVYVLISGLIIVFLLFTIYTLEKRKSKLQNENMNM